MGTGAGRLDLPLSLAVNISLKLLYKNKVLKILRDRLV